MKATVRSKDGGFAQFLCSHKAMALIVFTVVCIALYLVKISLGTLKQVGMPMRDEMIVPNDNILDYFKTGGDAAKITWAHAVNNRKYLGEVLKSDTMMLEADVQLDRDGIAIMAHPPAVTSDLTLETFLNETKASHKGIKLDFKTMEAAEVGIKAVSGMKNEMKGRIWLNADIIKGTQAPKSAVEGDKFLHLASTSCPECVLSLGWTLSEPKGDYKGGYDWPMVNAMHQVIQRNQLRQPITFAVEATYTILSTKQLEWLLAETSWSSLTIWFLEISQATAQDLVCLQEKFGKRIVYIDMPDKIRKEFDKLDGCNPV